MGSGGEGKGPTGRGHHGHQWDMEGEARRGPRIAPRAPRGRWPVETAFAGTRGPGSAASTAVGRRPPGDTHVQWDPRAENSDSGARDVQGWDWADSTRQSGVRREPGSPQRPGCRGARQDHHAAAALRAASRGTFDALTGADPRPHLSRRGPRALGVHGPVTRPACLGQRDRDGGAWSARGRGWAATGQPQHPWGPRAWLSLTARRGTQRRGLPSSRSQRIPRLNLNERLSAAPWTRRNTPA